jgi:hypothetical protein
MKYLIVFAILIDYIYNMTTCGSYLPKDLSSCTPYSTNSTHCCFLQSYSGDAIINTCYPIEKQEYYSLKGSMRLNGIDYTIDCGVSLGTTCGTIYNPKSHVDCGNSSTGSNSCCFYKYKGETGCVWLDTRSIGYVKYNGLELTCS